MMHYTTGIIDIHNSMVDKLLPGTLMEEATGSQGATTTLKLSSIVKVTFL